MQHHIENDWKGGAVRTLYRELTSEEIREAAEQDYIAVLPTGCIEQHGPHLPVDVDFGGFEDMLAEAAELARETHGLKILVMPPIPYGPANEHMGFPGTISISYQTYFRFLFEIAVSLIEHGFRRIALAPGCGGHYLEPAAWEVRRWAAEEGKPAVVWVLSCNYCEIGERLIPGTSDFHAGEFETSLVLATREHLVRKEKIRRPKLAEFSFKSAWSMHEISDTGASGDPTKATKETGEQIYRSIIEFWCAQFKEIEEGEAE